MAKRKETIYQGLQDIDVLIDESSPTSEYFNVTTLGPDGDGIFPIGRSTIKLKGSRYLLRGSEIRLEISVMTDEGSVDQKVPPKHKVIYTQPIRNYTEEDSIVTSLHIYTDDTQELFNILNPGGSLITAKLTIVGELDPRQYHKNDDGLKHWYQNKFCFL